MTTAPRRYKPKRRKMIRFRMDEISVVDKPAQEDATARLMKRRRDMSAYAPRNMQVVMAAKEAIQGIIAKAKEDLRGSSRSRFVETGEGLQIIRRGTDKANLDEDEQEHESEMTPARASEILQPYADDSVSPEEETESNSLYARLGEEEEDELDEDELDEDDDEEAALRHEVRESKRQLAEDEEDEEFDEDTEHGRIANALRRRDPSISKARAALMATGRRAAASGIYAKVATRATTYGKASRVTTDAYEPFHQPSAASRRAEMDRRARAHRSNVNDEIEAMRGAFGREGEMRRRAIDKMVLKLREEDRNMPHTVALQKIRRAYPGLFG